MSKHIKFTGFGHISITVDNIDTATVLYKELFGAVPIKHFLPIKDKNWAKNIGFSKNCEEVEVSNRFLLIPSINLYIELLQYHTPVSEPHIVSNPSAIHGISHICLTVNDIDGVFELVKQHQKLKIKCSLNDYVKPLKIATVTEKDFYFFDEHLENDPLFKNKAAYLTNTIRFFTFIDHYGITWELEESEEKYEFQPS
jgi:methylmalonyl-CoA/ethylmalonyl-CoA epimerase